MHMTCHATCPVPPNRSCNLTYANVAPSDMACQVTWHATHHNTEYNVACFCGERSEKVPIFLYSIVRFVSAKNLLPNIGPVGPVDQGHYWGDPPQSIASMV